MIALKDLIVLNNNWLKVMEEANDTVDSWDPANYADEPCLDNPEMRCTLSVITRQPRQASSSIRIRRDPSTCGVNVNNC
jgi:hypothetical protein